MALVRPVGPADWRVLRDIRLAALCEAPHAFASTYAREAAFTEADWLRRTTSGATFLAYLPEAGADPVGLAGGYLPEPAPEVAELVSMWVSPRARGRGAGEALIAAVVGWAATTQAVTVHLWVTESNKPARRLYERCGFVPTGERQPLPSSPDLEEVAMALSLTRGEAAQAGG
jgi:GNAT superfamily N-acetyltransferase